MSSKSKHSNQKFIQHCKSTMPTTVFNSLCNKIGVSIPTLRKYLNEPNTMPYDALKAFARMLKVTPIELNQKFDAGQDRITAREYQSMMADYLAEYNAAQRI